MKVSLVSRYLDSKNKKEVNTEVKKWFEVLSSYNYIHTEDIDKCLAEFVVTGYINMQIFADELNKKNEQFRVQKGDNSYRKAWDIYNNSFDDDEQEFVDRLMINFRSNINILSLSDLQSAVTALREFERNTLADTLVDEYFSQRNSEKETEGIKKLEGTINVTDLKDAYLLSRLRNIWTSKDIDKRSLADVLKAITFNKGWDLGDIRHMDSFSIDGYYNFFKAEKSDDLYFYVRKCLEFGELVDESGIYKSIGEKAKAALHKIASECRINRMRVSNLYGIEVN